MGFFSPRVTEQELRDYARGKKVRAAVAEEANRRSENKRRGRKADAARRATGRNSNQSHRGWIGWR